jgi:very-short-patch-repair endonuclease
MANQRARDMRKDMTPWKVRLWGRLRKDQLGARFRRQHPIGNYIADFACVPAKLIIEADGEHHNWFGNDQRRDAWLVSQGWRVMRYTNHEIQWDLNEVCRGIYGVAHERLFIPSTALPPSPLRGTSPCAALGEEVIPPTGAAVGEVARSAGAGLARDQRL